MARYFVWLGQPVLHSYEQSEVFVIVTKRSCDVMRPECYWNCSSSNFDDHEFPELPDPMNWSLHE